MNIASFVISLFTALLSFLQGGCGTAVLGLAGGLAGSLGDHRASREFAALGVAGLLVMLASLVGVVGGSLALARKKSASICLFVSAAMCGLAFLAGFGDAVVYGVLYAVAAFFAVSGSNSTEVQNNSPNSSTSRTSSEYKSLGFHFSDKKTSQTVNAQSDSTIKTYEPIIGLETEALLKRAFLFLEDGEFENAGHYLNQTLNQDAENARVYLGQLMLAYEAHSTSELIDKLSKPIEEEKLFQRALRFADDDYKKQLEDLAQASRDKLEQKRLAKEARIEKTYQEILALKKKASTRSDFNKILELASTVRGYKDIETICDEVKQARETEQQYQDVLDEKRNAKKSKDWSSVITHLSALKGYKDTKELLKEANETFEQVHKRENRKLFLGILLVVALFIAAIMAKPFVCYQIGKMYEDNAELDKAREWYLSAGGAEDDYGRYWSFKWGVENNSQSYRGKAYVALLNIDAKRGNDTAQEYLGLAYYHARGVEQDYSKAFEWFKKAAEQGNTYARYRVAEMYEEGKVLEQDYSKAFEWFKKVAERGDTDAQYRVAEMYEEGKGVERNINEAIKWYQKVVGYKDASEAIKRLTKEAEETRIRYEKVMTAFFEGRYDYITSADNHYDNPAIINMLAHIDYERSGKDYEKLTAQAEDMRKKWPASSKKNYEEAIELANKYPNSVSANKFLGDVYWNGWGVNKSPNNALKYFKLPAEQGDIYSMIAMASICEVMNYKAQASEWYQKLADSGNAEAQNKLRLFRERQKAQEAEKAYNEAQASEAKGNFETALAQYRRALELGHSEAQKRIKAIEDKQKSEAAAISSYADAEKYLNEKNYSRAFEIFRSLANDGYAPAQDKLAWMYQNGWGVEQSYTQAVSWFRKAAEQGNTEAMASMGLMYYRGWGVPQNYDTSLEWYGKAANQGSEVAQRRINSIQLLKDNKAKIASIRNGTGFPIPGTIFAETLSVREYPNTNSTRIKTLKTGHPVSISRTSESDNDYWFLVKTASGTEGWVLAGYVKLIDRDLSYEEVRNRKINLPADGYVATQEDNLNLRNIPAVKGSQVVEKLYGGTDFKAYEVFAGDTIDWYRIRTAYGDVGWVSGKYIKLRD